MPADLSNLKPNKTTKTTSTGGSQKFDMSGFEQIYQYLQNAIPQTPYPESMTQDEFMSLYNNFRNGMGMDDATLKANLEAAMRPGYDQSIAALDRARREGNAEIDVDAASRGMGDSTWVTDAKLRNLRNTENNIADLNANYNATLYNNLLNAMQNRDANALNNAWNWAQMQNQNDLNKWNAQNSMMQNAFSNAWSYWNSQRKSGGGGGWDLDKLRELFDKWYGDDGNDGITYIPDLPPKNPEKPAIPGRFGGLIGDKSPRVKE